MKITLEHKRVGLEFDGRITLEKDHALVKSYSTLRSFKKLTFSKMICDLSEELNKYPNAILVMRRIDRAGLLPYTMDEATTQLIKIDPLMAVRAMDHERVIVDTRHRSAPPPLLRAGHDTLADAFGDYVYLRRKGTRVESPFTGRWEEVRWDINKDLHGLTGFGVMYEIEKVNDRWMRIKTENLLKLPVGMPVEMANYYLPRAWNDLGPWINHEDLKKKYDEFNQERIECSRAIQEAN